MTARCAISWSAGKDSWLALMRAREHSLAVTTFVTMCDEDGTSKSHALPPDLIAAQVRALGGESRSVRVPPGEYAARFDAGLREVAASGHTHMVFGDIDLQAHRDWLAPACERAGLVALFPLWRETREALARELVARGVRARVVCVDTRWLDASYCGADYDAAFLARLPAGVCPCGEDGEFHTFVTGGPGFAAPLRVVDAPQRRVASQPPFAPTEFVFQPLSLAGPA
ncbi:adenosine nucleotide hydrolase [Scleromatobacter humisilvae]|uniref:Adenosine nucleotide hydrolase n=1 Tax=Scleromatobacter humisilvae TaxID=2897159 RepID=A0A9X1YHZ3_9BURK|nr:adenosine nucleotide hydrolase [Scleromatobacter humisilvae]MCK9686067.1 adenosine nucleotide hydrolase [Scleromatobacter humisilvae]